MTANESRIVTAHEIGNNNCVHGKIVGETPYVNKVVSGMSAGLIGTYVSSKRDDALIGTTVGYHFQTITNNKDFYIGVECPLSSIYGGNTCYCSFDGSAGDACDKAHKNQTTESSAQSDGYNLDIKCNSKSGSVAYYIARAYKA